MNALTLAQIYHNTQFEPNIPPQLQRFYTTLEGGVNPANRMTEKSPGVLNGKFSYNKLTGASLAQTNVGHILQ